MPHHEPVRLESIVWSGFARNAPPFTGASRPTGARKAGLRYEKLAQDHLEERYPYTYLRSPWLVYQTDDSARVRWCQPDGILFDWGRQIITIVEIKLHHTSDAYWQVMDIYLPVLRHAFRGFAWEYRFVEVVRWYDAAVHFPVAPALVPELSNVPRGRFGVHIWKRDRGTN